MLESSLQAAPAAVLATGSAGSLQAAVQQLQTHNVALNAELAASKSAPAGTEQAGKLDALRAECELLRAAVRERDEARARDEQRVHKLEGDLRALREATTGKLSEFDALKAALLRDLQTRCEKIVDLELLLEEAREQYEDLLKHSAARAAQHRVQQLEQALEALAAEHAHLTQQLAGAALDKEVADKKLSARSERIAALESVLATAQEKLLTHAASHQAEVAKYRAIIDSFRAKQLQQAPQPQLPAGLLPAHGPRIVKPLRGGVRSAATDGDDDGSSAPSSASQKGFWGSLFGSNAPPATPKKTAATATGTAGAVVSPRADGTDAGAPVVSPRPTSGPSP